MPSRNTALSWMWAILAELSTWPESALLAFVMTIYYATKDIRDD